MKHFNVIATLILVMFVLAVAGCTPAARKGAKSGSRATKAQPYDFEKEGNVPPVDERDRAVEPDVVETPVDQPDVDVEEAEIPEPEPEPETPPVEMVDGFRVQVFASASRDVAEGARRAAEARLGVAAYIEEDAGLYKVRVGDCKTREAAEALLEKCRGGMYKDAWIVETRVVAENTSAGN